MSGRVLRRVATAAVNGGSALAVALTVHTAYNLTRLRRPVVPDGPVGESVSILIPARDEAHNIDACLTSLLGQRQLADVEIIVLDDQSTDGTADVVRRVAGSDPRVRVIAGTDRPAGWLGKPWACQQIAQAARGQVLVFVDADVVVEPDGIAAAIDTMRANDLACVCPYPRQIAVTPAERLIQPLLQWSWLTTLPLGLAEQSTRPSLTAANGQLLLIDARWYDHAGGHAAVRGEVLDDIALMRALKAVGGRGTVVDGTALAECRMYEDWDQVRTGYTKSLWSAFGSPAGAAGAMAVLGLAYVAPVVGAAFGRRTGMIGAAAGVTGRVLVARRTGSRTWPDSLSHPASIAVLGYLTSRSVVEHRRGSLRWKGRPIDGS